MRLLFIVSLLCSCSVWAEHQSVTNTTNWQDAIPPNFSNLEHFFLKNNCMPVMGVSYIYQSRTGKWLSNQQARTLFPEADIHLASMLPNNEQQSGCALTATKQELKEIFGIYLPENSEYVLFFFDAFFNLQGQRSKFHPDSDKNMEDRFKKISTFMAIPKIHVKVNSVGLKPQRF